MSVLTQPRQVRINQCSIFSPGLENRVARASADKVKKEGIDIVPYLQEINIYESIFDNTISGNITVIENVGMIELIPIIGVEYLWLSWEVDDDNGGTKKFERNFRIVKVRDVSYPRHEHRMFTMDLTTHEFVSSVAHRISRQYKKKTCKEAVTDILKQDLEVPANRLKSVEDTYGDVTVTIPNYTPLQAINYFVILAQTKDKKESNFVFFETVDGFYFTSISKLIKDGKDQIEKDAKKQKDGQPRIWELDPGNVSGRMTTDDIVRNSLTRIYQNQTFDTLMDIAGGMLRSQMIHFDFLARKIQHIEDSRYTDTFKKTTHLGKFPVYPANYDQGLSKNVRTFTFPSNAWSKDSQWTLSRDPETPEMRLHEAIVLHNRQLKEATHIQTLIDLPGHPDLRAGTVMNIRYPSTHLMAGFEGSSSASIPVVDTPLFSGPHLVTSVRHVMIPQGAGQFEYRMHLTACRDSFGSEFPSFKEGEKYE